MGTSLLSLWLTHLPPAALPGLLSQPKQSPCPHPTGARVCIALRQPEPREGRTSPWFPSVSVCPSSPGRSTVAFHCHPLLPVLSLFPPLGFLGQCKGLGVAGARPGQDPLDPVVEVCLWEQSAHVPSGAIQLIPWVSCRAAGCPPERHSSPIVSLGCLGSPRSRHLSGRAREMLLGSCTWAPAMILLCTSLAGDS